jgi:ferrous iron transport protein B
MLDTVRTTPLRIALVGVPNCGKTALFNRLTGSHQKVANYPGVTVERKEGACHDAATGRHYRVLDLPGAYSLSATTLDEAITRDVVVGRLAVEPPPALIVNVVDATNLRLSLRLSLELRRLGIPMIVVMNLSDVAHKRGMAVDRGRLAAELGCPVVEAVAVRSGGEREVLAELARYEPPATLVPEGEASGTAAPATPRAWTAPARAEVEATQRDVRRILAAVGYREPLRGRAGPVVLATLLFLVFQAVFSWAALPMDLIDGGIGAIGEGVNALLPDGPLRSLLVDGIIAGAGGVLVFLPQILILFFFILVLEDSGYLPRAAFLLDRLMGGVGLSGRSFIPLLSSFACAIPGIMATRTIPNARDRLITIMIAPLMTCSARLPVYALLIAAFVPARCGAAFNLQGLVLFTLYVAGVASALLVAWVLKRSGCAARSTRCRWSCRPTTGRASGTCGSACGSARRSSCGASAASSSR